MRENWKYKQLHETIREWSIAEMIHGEKLIERILFLEGRPSSATLTKCLWATKCRRCTRMTMVPKR
jgi:bacterioferritin